MIAIVVLAGPPAAAVEPTGFLERYLDEIRGITGGDLPATFARTTYDLDATGALVATTSELPFQDHLRAIENVRSPEAKEQWVPPTLDRGCGSEAPGWLCAPDRSPFCDSASAWLLQVKAGSAAAKPVGVVLGAPRAPVGFGSGVTCGGFYGPTLLWPDVTIDSKLVPPGTTLATGAFANFCFSTKAPCGYANAFSASSHHLEGVYSVDQFCFFGFCWTFEYFLGNGAILSLRI